MSTSQPLAIEVTDLHRNFGSLKAVDGISFEISAGTVVGFVGANGAGKTTTMRILATLDYPTRGVAKIGGIDVVQYPSQVRAKIGWMPDSFGRYPNMTVFEYLDFFSRALGFRGKDRMARVEDVMDFTDLGPLSARLVNTLSKGMSQRLCLGRALIHDPEVLILDEPAAGLDPKARVELKHLIRILAEEGKTVLISSHILSELSEMCDSLLFINEGRIIHHGSAENLKHNDSGTTVIKVETSEDPQKVIEWLQLSPHAKLLEGLKNGALLEVDSIDTTVISDLLKRMVQDGLPIVDFHREERKLEDAFIDILGKIESKKSIPAATVPSSPTPVSKS
ncbi:MAG: ABC transporter ATP-binding protein [Verrucomicrobiales bacterium]|nr:ABC transporter ATP-binding protein [Verrucomicrobiales bacterium]